MFAIQAQSIGSSTEYRAMTYVLDDDGTSGRRVAIHVVTNPPTSPMSSDMSVGMAARMDSRCS
jgi:hypothetical protein